MKPRDDAPVNTTRTEQALQYVCLYALAHAGATPSSSELAAGIRVSRRRASYLLMRLTALRKIDWVTKQKYMVVNSTWDPPPEVEI